MQGVKVVHIATTFRLHRMQPGPSTNREESRHCIWFVPSRACAPHGALAGPGVHLRRCSAVNAEAGPGTTKRPLRAGLERESNPRQIDYQSIALSA
jgi:hypothetical protein